MRSLSPIIASCWPFPDHLWAQTGALLERLGQSSPTNDSTIPPLANFELLRQRVKKNPNSLNNWSMVFHVRELVISCPYHPFAYHSDARMGVAGLSRNTADILSEWNWRTSIVASPTPKSKKGTRSGIIFTSCMENMNSFTCFEPYLRVKC